jgi:hypothetical protein
MAVTHATDIRPSQIGGENLRMAGPDSCNLVTNQQVIDATAITGIETNITNAVCHAELQPTKFRINQGIDLGVSAGNFDATTVQAATTVNGLANTTESAPGTYGPLSDG